MKTLRRLLAFSLQLAALGFLVGCGTVAAVRAPFLTTTNTVPVIVTVPGVTNVLTERVPAATNTAGNVITITPAYVTNLVTITAARSVTNYVTNVSTVVNPALQSALDTVGTVNRFNPTPSAPLIDLALAGLLGALGWWARLKTRQANENAGLARTLVLGIEEAKSAETKTAVAKFSAAAGHAPQLNALVQKFTRA